MLPERVGNYWRRLRDAARTSLWPLPAAAVVLAAAAGVLLPELDEAVDEHLPLWLEQYLFGGGPSAARTVLSSIASSLISVTALTFSLTVVTLQLASSQFSPRLLRNFARDLVVQCTLALLLATFTYALTVLRVVRTADEDRSVFVPQFSVTLAFLLALTSVMALVLFLAHLTREIRVESMVRNVHVDARSTANLLAADFRDDGSVELGQLPARPETAIIVVAPQSGFITHVDYTRLADAAINCDALICLERRVGDAVVEGTPIGWASAVDQTHPLTDEQRSTLVNCADETIDVGFERTSSQDIALGVRQLTDVAAKALSPGINDPTTAVHALNHSAAFLCEVSSDALGARGRLDESGRLRLAFALFTFGELLNAAIDAPRRYGAEDPDVLAAVFALLGSVAWITGETRAEEIESQLQRTRRVVESGDFDSANRQRLHAAERDVRDALEHGPATSL